MRGPLRAVCPSRSHESSRPRCRGPIHREWRRRSPDHGLEFLHEPLGSHARALLAPAHEAAAAAAIATASPRRWEAEGGGVDAAGLEHRRHAGMHASRTAAQGLGCCVTALGLWLQREDVPIRHLGLARWASDLICHFPTEAFLDVVCNASPAEAVRARSQRVGPGGLRSGAAKAAEITCPDFQIAVGEEPRGVVGVENPRVDKEVSSGGQPSWVNLVDTAKPSVAHRYGGCS